MKKLTLLSFVLGSYVLSMGLAHAQVATGSVGVVGVPVVTPSLPVVTPGPIPVPLPGGGDDDHDQGKHKGFDHSKHHGYDHGHDDD